MVIIFLRPPFPSNPSALISPCALKAGGFSSFSLSVSGGGRTRWKGSLLLLTVHHHYQPSGRGRGGGQGGRGKKPFLRRNKKNNSREEGRLWWSSPPCSHRSNIVIIVVALLLLRLGMGIEGGNSPNRYALMVSLPNRSDSIAGFCCFSLLLLR